MKKLIELHKQWGKKGGLPATGLCGSIPSKYENTFELLNPTKDDYGKLANKRFSLNWWGSGLNRDDKKKYYTYTPLRQTIVLLICAMHDEI